MASPFKNYMVFRRRFSIGQERLIFRKGTQSLKALVFLHNSVFCIEMDEENFPRITRTVLQLLPLVRYAYPVLFCSSIHALVHSFVSFSLRSRMNCSESDQMTNLFTNQILRQPPSVRKMLFRLFHSSLFFLVPLLDDNVNIVVSGFNHVLTPPLTTLI